MKPKVGELEKYDKLVDEKASIDKFLDEVLDKKIAFGMFGILDHPKSKAYLVERTAQILDFVIIMPTKEDSEKRKGEYPKKACKLLVDSDLLESIDLT